MPETITIAGKKFPRTIVYGGALATLGIVGYAYYTKSVGGDVVEEDTALVDEFGDERITPTTIDTYDVKVDNNVGYKTETEWYNAAIDLLVLNFGVADNATAAAAVNKYLANQALTAAQVPMIQYVVNSIGIPPTGARAIRQETSTPTTPAQENRADPGPIRNLLADASRTQMLARWSSPNTGGTVKEYRVEFYGGRPGGGSFTTSVHTVPAGPSPNVKSLPNLKPNTPYGVRVTPIGVNGRPGPTANKSPVRTDK